MGVNSGCGFIFGSYDTLLQNATDTLLKKMRQKFITKCVWFFIQNAAVLLQLRQLLQNAFILLQNVTVTTKCFIYYKIRHYSVYTIAHN